MLQHERQVPRSHAVPEVLKQRAVPQFYVVDKDFRIVLACGGVPTAQQPDALPPSIERIARNLMHRVRHAADSVLGMDNDMVVRIVKPFSSDGNLTCIIVEKLRTRDPLSEAVKKHGITNRQSQVLNLLMQGAPNIDIAAQLHIAQTTVEDHVKNIAAKTDARSRSQIVARVLGFV